MFLSEENILELLWLYTDLLAIYRYAVCGKELIKSKTIQPKKYTSQSYKRWQNKSTVNAKRRNVHLLARSPDNGTFW